ncbi:MAG: ISNCY family transposase [Acidobacteria bacterium]|nr:ISNCY family transposase [Acidobacteriota bacterium]
MTQVDRDRLVALRKAATKTITQKQAAEELGLSIRHVKRLVRELKKRGDEAVVHRLRGKASNRRIEEAVEQEAMEILSRDVYRGFGPTLASEYLRDKHGIQASKETVRQWMIGKKLWLGKREKVKEVHLWRPRRSRCGELVQWDTSTHDWLEGRGETISLIAMIDDATSRLFARFVRHDSTAENMKLAWSYLEKFGRPVSFYTDKASLFRTAEKRRRDEPGVDKDPVEMPPTQIARALGELGIGWIAAHSPQAKGRVERNFLTAQDRLVKGLRVAGAKTLEQANQYLEESYLVWWERELTVTPASPDDAHRPLEAGHNLASAWSHVETRQVRNDYTLRFDRMLYRVKRESIVTGLRGATVRVEKRLDGSVAVRYQDRYLDCALCEAHAVEPIAAEGKPVPAVRKPAASRSNWNETFDLKKAPPIWKAAQGSGHRTGEGD